jgi:hypothetical protein
MSDHTESFRLVPGIHGYRVSAIGRVQSCWIKGCRSRPEGSWHDLNPLIDKGGYLYVRLTINGRNTRRYIHELVLTTFDRTRPDGLECRHLNGNPLDNRWPENICWGTPSENITDEYRNGRFCHWARIRPEDASEIRRLYIQGLLQKDIAVMYGLTPSQISQIVNRKTWKRVV